jgi:ABC-type sugar transport system ATPase subunit
VLGLAGLLGSGRTELVRAIFGLDSVDAGEIYVKGERVGRPTPENMKNHKVALTPEDRKRQGLVLPFSVSDNLTLASMDRFSVSGVLQRARGQEMAAAMVQSMAIKTPGLHVAAQTLSGGNQQKVVVGNWLNTLPEVLLMDEPTRGIDIQAKEQIFSLVRDLATQGLAVVFISSEIEEVLDVADRILVMREGRIVAEVKPDEVDLERLLAMVMEETEE